MEQADPTAPAAFGSTLGKIGLNQILRNEGLKHHQKHSSTPYELKFLSLSLSLSLSALAVSLSEPLTPAPSDPSPFQ